MTLMKQGQKNMNHPEEKTYAHFVRLEQFCFWGRIVVVWKGPRNIQIADELLECLCPVIARVDLPKKKLYLAAYEVILVSHNIENRTWYGRLNLGLVQFMKILGYFLYNSPVIIAAKYAQYRTNKYRKEKA